MAIDIPINKRERKQLREALNSTAVPISCQIIQSRRNLKITTDTGQNQYSANIKDGEFGKINDFRQRGWIEHDGIYHQISTRLLESPLGKFCINCCDETKLESHGAAGEIMASAVQKFMDPDWKGNYISGNMQSNANIQAFILIMQVWMDTNITDTQLELFRTFKRVKTNQLEKQLWEENKNPRQDLVIRLPRVKWLDDIENANFEMPTQEEIEKFQARYLRELEYRETSWGVANYDEREVVRNLPETVRRLFGNFENFSK